MATAAATARDGRAPSSAARRRPGDAADPRRVRGARRGPRAAVGCPWVLLTLLVACWPGMAGARKKPKNLVRYHDPDYKLAYAHMEDVRRAANVKQLYAGEAANRQGSKWMPDLGSPPDGFHTFGDARPPRPPSAPDVNEWLAQYMAGPERMKAHRDTAALAKAVAKEDETGVLEAIKLTPSPIVREALSGHAPISVLRGRTPIIVYFNVDVVDPKSHDRDRRDYPMPFTWTSGIKARAWYPSPRVIRVDPLVPWPPHTELQFVWDQGFTSHDGKPLGGRTGHLLPVSFVTADLEVSISGVHNPGLEAATAGWWDPALWHSEGYVYRPTLKEGAALGYGGFKQVYSNRDRTYDMHSTPIEMAPGTMLELHFTQPVSPRMVAANVKVDCKPVLGKQCTVFKEAKRIKKGDPPKKLKAGNMRKRPLDPLTGEDLTTVYKDHDSGHDITRCVLLSVMFLKPEGLEDGLDSMYELELSKDLVYAPNAGLLDRPYRLLVAGVQPFRPALLKMDDEVGKNRIPIVNSSRLDVFIQHGVFLGGVRDDATAHSVSQLKESIDAFIEGMKRQTRIVMIPEDPEVIAALNRDDPKLERLDMMCPQLDPADFLNRQEIKKLWVEDFLSERPIYATPKPMGSIMCEGLRDAFDDHPLGKYEDRLGVDFTVTMPTPTTLRFHLEPSQLVAGALYYMNITGCQDKRDCPRDAADQPLAGAATVFRMSGRRNWFAPPANLLTYRPSEASEFDSQRLEITGLASGKELTADGHHARISKDQDDIVQSPNSNRTVRLVSMPLHISATLFPSKLLPLPKVTDRLFVVASPWKEPGYSKHRVMEAPLRPEEFQDIPEVTAYADLESKATPISIRVKDIPRSHLLTWRGCCRGHIYTNKSVALTNFASGYALATDISIFVLASTIAKTLVVCVRDYTTNAPVPKMRIRVSASARSEGLSQGEVNLHQSVNGGWSLFTDSTGCTRMPSYAPQKSGGVQVVAFASATEDDSADGAADGDDTPPYATALLPVVPRSRIFKTIKARDVATQASESVGSIFASNDEYMTGDKAFIAGWIRLRARDLMNAGQKGLLLSAPAKDLFRLGKGYSHKEQRKDHDLPEYAVEWHGDLFEGAGAPVHGWDPWGTSERPGIKSPNGVAGFDAHRMRVDLTDELLDQHGFFMLKLSVLYNASHGQHTVCITERVPQEAPVGYGGKTNYLVNATTIGCAKVFVDANFHGASGGPKQATEELEELPSRRLLRRGEKKKSFDRTSARANVELLLSKHKPLAGTTIHTSIRPMDYVSEEVLFNPTKEAVMARRRLQATKDEPYVIRLYRVGSIDDSGDSGFREGLPVFSANASSTEASHVHVLNALHRYASQHRTHDGTRLALASCRVSVTHAHRLIETDLRMSAASRWCKFSIPRTARAVEVVACPEDSGEESDACVRRMLSVISLGSAQKHVALSDDELANRCTANHSDTCEGPPLRWTLEDEHEMLGARRHTHGENVDAVSCEFDSVFRGNYLDGDCTRARATDLSAYGFTTDYEHGTAEEYQLHAEQRQYHFGATAMFFYTVPDRWASAAIVGGDKDTVRVMAHLVGTDAISKTHHARIGADPQLMRRLELPIGNECHYGCTAHVTLHSASSPSVTLTTRVAVVWREPLKADVRLTPPLPPGDDEDALGGPKAEEVDSVEVGTPIDLALKARKYTGDHAEFAELQDLRGEPQTGTVLAIWDLVPVNAAAPTVANPFWPIRAAPLD